MKTMYFKCKLLTDVILHQRAATEGNQESLDFIPGNNFLGIVAGKLYASLDEKDSLYLFHSGKVRFGDAHPEKDGKRYLRIPTSFYKPKLDNKEGLYIFHEVTDTKNPDYKDFQPKQCRTGFYLFENKKIEEIKIDKTFAIKSAYDRDSRRSADAKMYGYESLQAGSTWLFEVAVEDESFAEKITKALVGKNYIGRSRTAQYGQILIEELPDYKPKQYLDENKSFVLVYADARLIFLDEFGLPTFQPTAKDLGFEGGEIDWEKTQIRTFQYAPWNFKRQARDADRCGIEKGSVFYVKIKNEEFKSENYVGYYQNEGFGKVIYNPNFLKAKPDSNGKALYTFKDKDNSNNSSNVPKATSTDKLFVYLKTQKKQVEHEHKIYELVNDFVEKNKNAFGREAFASQWGSIRSIATINKKKTDLEKALFAPETGYLTHGVAKDKWDERGRRDTFRKFFDKLTDENCCVAIINLAAEMAKITRRK